MTKQTKLLILGELHRYYSFWSGTPSSYEIASYCFTRWSKIWYE